MIHPRNSFDLSTTLSYLRRFGTHHAWPSSPQLSMNPFYKYDTPITSKAFDARVRAAARAYLSWCIFWIHIMHSEVSGCQLPSLEKACIADTFDNSFGNGAIWIEDFEKNTKRNRITYLFCERQLLKIILLRTHVSFDNITFILYIIITEPRKGADVILKLQQLGIE